MSEHNCNAYSSVLHDNVSVTCKCTCAHACSLIRICAITYLTCMYMYCIHLFTHILCGMFMCVGFSPRSRVAVPTWSLTSSSKINCSPLIPPSPHTPLDNLSSHCYIHTTGWLYIRHIPPIEIIIEPSTHYSGKRKRCLVFPCYQRARRKNAGSV